LKVGKGTANDVALAEQALAHQRLDLLVYGLAVEDRREVLALLGRGHRGPVELVLGDR
jgi:hypothetical protein